MDNLVSEGLNLMIFGMGFVAVFLTLLVFATTGMSKVVGRFFPEAAAQPKAKKATPAASNNDDELIAVMTAAVHKYRS
ncbi:MAG: oxaloacetate decarboxylase [Neptuniibacter caesariensis]|uniref:Probable oxaloacetate decarboxylase gamma chain n=1 Tax=Neptuniibacter caesariensis TaxID=207954 RepID=A0A2G6JNG4_NEPCE|nr:MAG: oxaloacetate decarboxylase [Neptuniibacter caesariensis]